MKKLYFLLILFITTSMSFGQIVINEVDADTAGTDVAEFIELLWTPNTSLDGYVVVGFNGSDDLSYSAYDLDGYSTDANGFFILANSPLVVAGDFDLGASNIVQNGADALAIYQADDTDFPNDTAMTMTDLIDAFVYDTSDTDDAGLLTGLGETTQYNEGENGNKDTESNQRSNDGSTYIAQDPTFRAVNFGTDPTLALTDAPPSGSTLTVDPEAPTNSSIDFTTTNFNVDVPSNGDGYIKWTLKNSSDVTVDSGDIFTTDGTETPVTGLVVGETFNLEARLVDNSGDPLVPDVVYTLEIIVAIYNDVADLGVLRTSTVSDDLYYRVTGEVFNTFSRGGVDNQQYFQDALGAILVFDTDYEVGTYNVGDGVMNMRGHLTEVSDVLQFIPTETGWGTANSTGSIITPLVVDIATLEADINAYESRLIKIDAVTFADAGSNFVPAAGATGNYDITDASGTTTFRTNFTEVDYVTGGDVIPSGDIDLIVLVSEFFGAAQVTARSSVDMTASLSVAQNEIEGFSVYPNPVNNGEFSVKSLNNVSKQIQIFDMLGKQVYNKDVQPNETVRVSNLNSGIYILKVEEEGKTATRKLVIK